MNINKKRKSTGRSVNNKQRTSVNDINRKEQESIFREVTINLSNTEYNQKQKKKKKKKKKHKILRMFLTVLLIIFIIFTATFLKRWNDNGWTLGGLVATILGHDANTLANLPRLNILVVGQSQTLTDTIMVCSYDPKTQDLAMLSIPRDTFVGKNKNIATGSNKINSLFQQDPNKLLKAVNDITGLNIQYYIKVDTQGLKDLVDSVGGIYFDVPVDMDYDDSSQDLHIHVKAGYQLLNGDKAEQVVRFRHNNDGTSYPIEYGDQDLGRMKTQRAFITEVIKQVVRSENITKVDDYIRIASNNVETNFSLWSLKDYAPYAIDFKTDNIRSEMLPGTPEKCNGLWFYIYNKKKTEVLVKEMFNTELSEEQEKNAQIKVSILNGTNDDMKLENLKSLLKESGYTIVTPGQTSQTSQTQTTAIINRTGQDDEVASTLKEIIGVGVVSKSTSSSSEVDFTIIIGADY